ncbi:hypothetical protein P186_1004 [Pyrobaculum ferrireducens]|uniref:Uncharacterized protein n=1 Tax=Pyrobaculum ferrireducens TaxID=1104324 RepID=G7VBL3_9CREN|nr:hypothetical protein P186_1004 [Pyrobaculum ferrireducens]
MKSIQKKLYIEEPTKELKHFGSYLKGERITLGRTYKRIETASVAISRASALPIA